MNNHFGNLSVKSYRHIFLVQNRSYWEACDYPFDKEKDLVLAFDFALIKEIKDQGGYAAYLDHLVPPEAMERHNVETYHFFENWYRDKNGVDLFFYKGIDIGNAFRLDIWNDVTYFVRMVANLLAVKGFDYKRMYVGIEDSCTLEALVRLGFQYEEWACNGTPQVEYYFPVFRWMKERIRPKVGLKPSLKNMLSRVIDAAFLCGERLGLLRSAKVDVFIERYFSTLPIIEQLKRDSRLNVVLEHYTWNKGISMERRIPAAKPAARHKELVMEILKRFSRERVLRWEMSGFCVSDALYDVITKKIGLVLPLCFNIIDGIVSFFEKRELRLMVYIANSGLLNCLLLDYCKKHNIPSYFILNGLLLHSFPEEDVRGISWINAYGESIKKNYFRGADNVVCLGDPRLDAYTNNHVPKEINYSEPTILIGAGGFSPIDLNSYAAIEFEFLNDILIACRILREKGRKFKINLKVRSNGYIGQYQDFTKEYFPDLSIKIFDSVPFSQVLVLADFYISVYSGTHFEAAALGIPTLYYKNDVEKLLAPYDGKSELVTAFSVAEIVSRMEQFYNQDAVYGSFEEKKVLEKYVGPLDGKNLHRNLDFIYSLCGLEPLPGKDNK